MLKRQRPATPPPSSLDDNPSFLPDSLMRPPHSIDPFQPRAKRQRTRPPPLDGALRGWLESGPSGPHGESDGEEDWTEDAGDTPLPPSMTMDQYKDTNSLLHELHVLNQHRLSFVHSPRDRCLDLVRHNHTRGPLVQECTPPYHTASPQPTHGRLENQNYCIGSAEEKRLVEEVECVRQRYEDANRFLGSLFLSRRREVESNPR